MAKIEWSDAAERTFETGVDRGVIYPNPSLGVPWMGLKRVAQSLGIGAPSPYYFDGVKYLEVPSFGDVSGVVEAITYPDELLLLEGWSSFVNGLSIGGQRQPQFGLSYRTLIGNPNDGVNHGYKLHILYNVTIVPADREYETINDSPEASEFTWTFTTVPEAVVGYRPTANVFLDTKNTHPQLMAQIEDILYGTVLEDARFPGLQELKDLCANFVPV